MPTASVSESVVPMLFRMISFPGKGVEDGTDICCFWFAFLDDSDDDGFKDFWRLFLVLALLFFSLVLLLFTAEAARVVVVKNEGMFRRDEWRLRGVISSEKRADDVNAV